MSLTDDHVNLLNFDTDASGHSDQKSLFVNGIDSSTGHSGPSSVTTNVHLIPSTQHAQHQHTVTATVPYRSQLNTTIHMSPDLIEKSKQSLEVNIQAEYHMKTPPANPNGNLVEDDDFIPPEPSARTDYGKKALVGTISIRNNREILSLTGFGCAKLPSIEIYSPLPSLHQ
jgi:hypothetical protein